MTERTLFNRTYTSYSPAGTPVWLLNGAGVTTSLPSTQSLVAATNLIQGQPVYVSGTYALPATSASGVSFTNYSVIGITAEAAATNAGVRIVTDDVAVISSANLTADTSLIPGSYYYLSKFTGQITRYSTASGEVTLANNFAAVVNVGYALSSTELQVEIEQPIILNS